MDPNRNDKKPSDDKKPKLNIWIMLLLTVGIILLISSVWNLISSGQYTKATYSDILQEMEKNNLQEVELPL